MTHDEMTERKNRIQAAFEKLAILPGKADSLKAAVTCLMTVDSSGSGTASKKFTRNDYKTLAELKKLQKISTKLAEFIDHEMQQCAIAGACPEFCV